MKLILQAIKSLFRKVYAKLAAMEADTNGKLDELRKTVDALTPMVVHITSDSNKNPVIDKTFDEVMEMLKSGRKVEAIINGSFATSDTDAMTFNNEPLQMQFFNDNQYSLSNTVYNATLHTTSVLIFRDYMFISKGEVEMDYSTENTYFFT